MSVLQQEAYGPLGALKSKVECLAITSASAIFDLSTRTNIYADLTAGRLCLADADGADVYYVFSSENSGTVDNTNTTAANATQCVRIPTGALVEFRPPKLTQQEVNSSAGALVTTGMCKYLIAKTASGTATLRLAIVSESLNHSQGA